MSAHSCADHLKITQTTRELPSLTSDSVTVPTASTAKTILPRSHIHTSQQTIAALFPPTSSLSHLLMTNCTSSPLRALQSLMFWLTANGPVSEEHENTLKYRCSALWLSEGLGHGEMLYHNYFNVLIIHPLRGEFSQKYKPCHHLFALIPNLYDPLLWKEKNMRYFATHQGPNNSKQWLYEWIILEGYCTKAR